MRGKISIVLVAIVLMSCSKESFRTGRGLDYSYGRDIPHNMIVLGDRLENPYTTENMSKALQSLYPTRADRVDVKATNLYVRFLPADDSEYEQLRGLGLDMMDHPLDYDIAVEGDWYHDPSVPENKVTWQYAVVPHGFDFPDIRYELIDECYIAENDPGTRADGIDWQEVEREAYRLTGNEGRLAEPLTRASGKMVPAGRITIEDKDYKGGQPFGVSGVMVSCNSFVKFDQAYTDRDGYYQMEKSFSSDIRYRLIFKNEKGFSIGFNLVLVPASVSTLGKSSPEGVSVTVTEDSEDKLFRRCVVNNAAYDYITRCNPDDMDIAGIRKVVAAGGVSLTDLVCPGSRDEAVSSAELLDFNSCSYIYLGAWGKQRHAKLPVVIDRPGNHPDSLHVLFNDGSVEFFKLENCVNIKRVAGFLHTKYNYSEEDFGELIKRASLLDDCFEKR